MNDDLISRDAVIFYIKGHIHEIITESGEDKNAHTNRVLRALINGVETMPSVNPQEPCGDVVALDFSADIDEPNKYQTKDGKWHEGRIPMQEPSETIHGSTYGGVSWGGTYNPQEPKTEQFAKWVASEIFDEMWEYNKDTFAEIACRKLAKLGIVRAKGDEWELVEPQESEEISDTNLKMWEEIFKAEREG